MADDNKNLNDGQKKNGDFRMPPRNWVVWILLLFVWFWSCRFTNMACPSAADAISQNRFKELVDSNLINNAVVKLNPQAQTEDIIGKLPDKDGTPVAHRAHELPGQRVSDAGAARMNCWTNPISNTGLSSPRCWDQSD